MEFPAAIQIAEPSFSTIYDNISQAVYIDLFIPMYSRPIPNFSLCALKNWEGDEATANNNNNMLD